MEKNIHASHKGQGTATNREKRQGVTRTRAGAAPCKNSLTCRTQCLTGIFFYLQLCAPNYLHILHVRKQHTNHMEHDIFKRILQDKQFHLQLKSEQKEIIQNVLERKDSMTVLTTGFRKSMCHVLPPFWTR